MANRPAQPRTSEPSEPSEPSVKDTIVRAIVRGLYDGRYAPGQRLQEAQLTAAYGASRGPVREALNTLAAMNIVDLAPQRGAQVRVLRVEEAIDTLVVAQTLTGLSARLAAMRADDVAACDRLQSAVAAVIAFPPDADGSAFAVARDAFYGAISAMTGSAELQRLLPTVRVHLIRVQFRPMLRANDPQRARDYRRIADAVLGGRAKDAEAAAQVHLGHAITRLRDFAAR